MIKLLILFLMAFILTYFLVALDDTLRAQNLILKEQNKSLRQMLGVK